MSWIDFLKDKFIRKVPSGAKRHPLWRNLRNAYIQVNPECAVCGSTKKTHVHHIIPYWVAPELELEPDNLITLCMSGNYGIKCHLVFGHLGNWQKINMHCRADVKEWREKLGQYPELKP